MKIEPQSTADLVRLGALVADMSVAMLTSGCDDGALVSCPMEALEMDGEGALWFFTDLRSDLAERLRAVNLGFADEVRGTYVSISGRGEIAKDAARIARLWTLFDRAAFPEGLNRLFFKSCPARMPSSPVPIAGMVDVSPSGS